MHLWCCFMMTTILKMTTFVAVTSPHVRAHSGSPERTQVEISFTNQSASSSPPTFCYHIFVISSNLCYSSLSFPLTCLSFLITRSYLSSAHIFPWVSVMMGQSCIPAVATVFRTEMVHYREVCVFGPTLSFQSNLFNSLSWYYITWTGTQTSQQAPSPLSSWKEIYSVKMYSKFIWWDWPRR